MNIQMGCSRFLGSQGFPTWERDMTIFWCPFLLIKMELHQYIYLIYTCSIYTERWVIEIFKIFEKPHHNNWSTSQVCLGATLSWTGAYSSIFLMSSSAVVAEIMIFLAESSMKPSSTPLSNRVSKLL